MKSEFLNPNSKPSYALMSTISGHVPIADHGFHLNKEEFRDALCLRYDWSLTYVPQHCNCGKLFSVDHAMTCHLGGFLTVRHNDMRDNASLLTEVCHNVATEPTLQLTTSWRNLFLPYSQHRC